MSRHKKNKDSDIDNLVSGLQWYLETELIPIAEIDAICLSMIETEFCPFESVNNTISLPMQLLTIETDCFYNEKESVMV